MEKEILLTKLEGIAANQSKSTKEFQRLVRLFYREHGRSFPWRNTENAYEIFVSEIMLQQTQTERVVPKYLKWLERFPDWRSLAAARLEEVLSEWAGLGYYRRARNLHLAAKEIVLHHNARCPETIAGLMSLPGVGAYTAAAVQIFAYKARFPLIETNIRTVYLHLLFPRRKAVTDGEILKEIEDTLPRRNCREWFYALMDLGVFIKQVRGNAGIRSAHHRRQSPFVGSRRQVRAAVLRAVATQRGVRKDELIDRIPFDSARIAAALDDLEKEGFLVHERGRYRVTG